MRLGGGGGRIARSGSLSFAEFSKATFPNRQGDNTLPTDLAIPGVEPFIAAGPIMGALAGLGVGAATGGLVGALVGMGMPEYEAKRYEGRVKDGGILVSVHCDNSDWVGRAKDILERSGAQDVASAGEKAVSSHTLGSDTASEPARDVSNNPYKIT